MLSRHVAELEEIERSGTFSNYGPVNTRLEERFAAYFGTGSCVTTCNATLALMLAIRDVAGENNGQKRYALMPSFTFAATAQAALWAGLTPLLCDVDPETWLPSAECEEQLLQQYQGQIAVLVPYATFGNNLDLARYERLADQYGMGVVVDAASSLGSRDCNGQPFGAGFSWPVVFSMHATKVFAAGEGGLIYCADAGRIHRLRVMGCFGFDSDRSASMLALNAKLSEVAALLALLQLEALPDALQARDDLHAKYVALVQGKYTLQRQHGKRQARGFQSVLLSADLRDQREQVMQQLSARGIGSSTYFSPHLQQQPYFAMHAVWGDLSVTEDIASRILTLPLFQGMLPNEVQYVVEALDAIMEGLAVHA